MIKMVFFDIDGTLYDQRARCVPARARRAVAALRARGIRVIIATGRHPIELSGAGIDDIEFDGYVAANGQMCLDDRRSFINGHAIGPVGMASLIRLFERKETIVWFFAEDVAYVNRTDDAFAALLTSWSGSVPEVRQYGGEQIFQAVAFTGPENDEWLKAQLPGCRLQRWGTEGVDIISDNGGKVEGMRYFLACHGAAADECMAFGDQHNDLEMLRFAGVGVAMGNAVSEIRDAADYVTHAVDADGIAHALEHFGLLEDGWDHWRL